MASKSQYRANELGAEISELLDTLERLIDRTKVLYEQYFMGIQKVAPAQLHRDIERKIRELTQKQIRNTALRYRLTTLTQKFGAYNTYWRRTMREIEQGRYIRDLARVRRKAMRRGEEIPEELVAAMPKLMRDRIKRDREKMAQRQARDEGHNPGPFDGEDTEQHDAPANILDSRRNVHRIEPDLLDGDMDDFDKLFDALTASAEEAVSRHGGERAAPSAQPPARPQPASPQRARAGIYPPVQSPEQPPSGSRRPPPLHPDKPPAAVENQPSRAPNKPMVIPPSGPLRKPRHFTPKPEIAREQDAGPNDPATQPSWGGRLSDPRSGDIPKDGRTRPGWGFPETSPSGRPTRPRARGPQRQRPAKEGTQVEWPTSQSDPRRANTAGPRIGRRPGSGNAPPGMTENQARTLHKRYLQARKMVGESTDIPYERMVKTLSDQTSRIMEQHKARSVDFKVVIKDDKVVLKAKPKR